MTAQSDGGTAVSMHQPTPGCVLVQLQTEWHTSVVSSPIRESEYDTFTCVHAVENYRSAGYACSSQKARERITGMSLLH